MRALWGDRGAAICEFLVLGGIVVGSLGLFVGAWMPAKAPWGFAIPVLFVAGALLIELRRQAELRGGADGGALARRYDWVALLWSFGCALAGAAAFVIAWSAKPAPPQQDWVPPRGAIIVDMGP